MLQTISGGAIGLDTDSGPNVVSHGDSADFIAIPDAALLFSGDFKRSGADLILSDHTLQQHLNNLVHFTNGV